MAKVIMLQGTMSNVGKSFLTAALCRIFRQDGYSAAPFKSQNMGLNSFVTGDGLEISRAQAMQAEAAGTEPSALMNPILLKPTADSSLQLIVNGKVRGNYSAADYFRMKKTLLPEAMTAYETLAAQHDIIVIEGAGSPVELNIKQDDFVNMGLAQLVKAPVLLVGDIDRGGVFAQLLGTLSLLEQEERQLVKGLVVNRFRGDRALFADGVRILEERGRTSVLGVVPHIRCEIEDEDSLSQKLHRIDAIGAADIAVIRLPRISDFRDFDVFGQYEGVSVRYVTNTAELGNPDFIILPGTKNTISDMRWLRECGLEKEVQRCALRGTPVFGICGGYQMLGMSISDPEGIEGGSIPGMGLLPCKTVFNSEKQQGQVQGRFWEVSGWFECLSGAHFSGYEMHMGRTTRSGGALTTCGGTWSGNVAGCYVHGIFDSMEVSDQLVRKLLHNDMQGIDRRSYKEHQYDILAENVRRNLDMAQVYAILEESSGAL